MGSKPECQYDSEIMSHIVSALFANGKPNLNGELMLILRRLEVNGALNGSVKNERANIMSYWCSANGDDLHADGARRPDKANQRTK